MGRNRPLVYVWLVAVVGLAACSSSTDPGGEPGDPVTFLPGDEAVVIESHTRFTFRVEIAAGHQADVEFRRGTVVLARATEYIYAAGEPGVDSLTAWVTMSGVTVTHDWRIAVQVDPDQLPPPVAGLRADHGERPTEVVVTWDRPAPSQLPHPLDAFLVVVSYAGIIEGGNWDAATLLRTVPAATGGLFYRVLLDADHDGLQPGAQAWFAVRARDEDGRLGPVTAFQNVQLRISAPYWIDGVLVDDAGDTVPGAVVSFDTACDTCRTYTQSDGSFRLGPFPDYRKLLLTTSTYDDEPAQPGTRSYYDLVAHADRTDSLGVESPQPVELMLIRRYGLSAACPASIYHNHFLEFLRNMTRTDGGALGYVRLYKWEEYPVPVWIPAGMNEAGTVDMKAEAIFALELWNEILADQYFTITESPDNARIVLSFEPDEHNALFGQTRLLDPPQANGVPPIGTVVPRLIEVAIFTDLNTQQIIREITLHELGHSLILSNESECGPAVHIMGTPVGMLAGDPLNAVHPDEIRAVRCIRNLPQGFPMTGFEQPTR